MRKLIKFGLIILLLIGFLIVVLASAKSLFEDRQKIYNKLFGSSGEVSNLLKSKDTLGGPGYRQIDVDWAKKVLNGGYILFFRHAERDKWPNVLLYDSLATYVHSNGTDGTRYAENEYFANAVCLNARGKIQAKAMGEVIRMVNMPIGHIASSPICRSRQTAELAFGEYDSLHRVLVYQRLHSQSEKNRVQGLKDLFLKLPVEPNKNTIVSAHTDVISVELFDDRVQRRNIKLEEGGFLVMSRTNQTLKLEHNFPSFAIFTKSLMEQLKSR